MENISSFLRACRDFGVREHDLFETVDLYEEKDLGLVCQCIASLGRAVQNMPSYRGPSFGPREAKKNTRNFTPSQQKEQSRNAVLYGSKQTVREYEYICIYDGNDVCMYDRWVHQLQWSVLTCPLLTTLRSDRQLLAARGTTILFLVRTWDPMV